MIRDGVYGARCGSWMYRKGRSCLDVKQRETFTCVVEEKARLILIILSMWYIEVNTETG